MKSGLFDTEALTKECPEGFLKQCEGSTAVLFPPAQKRAKAPASATGGNGGGGGDEQAVFYNPAQVVNRDLSVCAIEAFSRARRQEPPRRGGTQRGITVLEALSATGLRAIRYYKEITNVRYVIANDLDGDAVDCIVRNAEFNKVPVAYPTPAENFPSDKIVYREEAEEPKTAAEEEREDAGGRPRPPRTTTTIVSGGAIIPNKDDAVDLMHRLAAAPQPGARLCYQPVPTAPGGEAAAPRALLQSEAVDVVDLDPYGSASPFLDGALRCVKQGGLLLVTSTDSAILCGNYPDTCHAKYNSVPYKGSHCHEMAVRILLACLERAANKHGKYIVPLISLHIDFYVRCFVRVYEQPAETKLSACKLAHQLQCTHCPAFWVRPLASFRTRRTKRSRREQERESAAAQEGAGGGGTRPRRALAAEQAAEKERAALETEEAPGPADAYPREVYPGPARREEEPKVSAGLLTAFPPLVPHRSDLFAEATHARLNTSFMCPVCGSPVSLSGPLYAAPTQDRQFLAQLLAVIEEREAEGRLTATARVRGLVRVALEELPAAPLFYELPDISSYIRARCPATPLFVSALHRLGYSCSQVHCSASGLKTDAPPDVLFRVMLAWKQREAAKDKSGGDDHNEEEGEGGNDGGEKKRREDWRQPVRLLLEPLEGVDFTYIRECDFRQRATGVVKFVPNAPGWGPKRRHQGAAKEDGEEEDGKDTTL